MDYLMLLAGVVGFGPAVAVLWYLLQDYDYPRMEKSLFNDTKVFGLVAAGMILGTVLFIMEGPLYQSFHVAPTDEHGGALDPGMFFLVYVVLFTLAEEGG